MCNKLFPPHLCLSLLCRCQCHSSYSTGLQSSIKALYKSAYTFWKSWLVENFDGLMVQITIWNAVPGPTPLSEPYISWKPSHKTNFLRYLWIGQFVPIFTVKSYVGLNCQKKAYTFHDQSFPLTNFFRMCCVSTFPCSLPRTYPNEKQDKLQ